MATAFSDPSTMLSCLSSLCSLEPEDLLNEILQDKSDSPFICRNCDEVAKATSRCKDCDELLCENCVRAHIRVKLTKEHCIVSLDEHHISPSSSYSSTSNVTSGNSPNSLLNGNSNLNCDIHLAETVRMYCDNCTTIFCQDCNSLEHRGHNYVFMQDAIDCARNSSVKLITEAKMSAQAAKDCLEISQRMQDSLNSRSQVITREIRSIMRRFHMAIDERERELLTKLERIRTVKSKAIQNQIETYKTLFSCFTQSLKGLSDVLEIGTPIDVIQARDNVAIELKRLRSIRSNMGFVDDCLQFIPPDCSILLAISTMGEISGFNQQRIDQPPTIGEEILRNVGPRPPTIYHNRNYLDDFSNIAECIPIIPVISQEKPPLNELSKFPLWTSGYRTKEAPHLMLKASRIRNSTLGNNQRDYTEAGDPFLIIGREGEEEGQLCRPWGVCCNQEGNIIVADRSNNRIQIFKPDGSFLYKFGSHGSEPGLFDRPAGVATDPQGRIIVTDKDNHRIQVFTHDGIFVFTFGEKGSKIGQFNYPWDVAVDAQGRIVVSDTRNHRIQLFDNDGVFIAKYGFENMTNMVKHFDSPRGVCFGSKGCVIATDFNNHRLVVIDPNFRNARFLGTEGCGEKQFLRPQGVAVDPSGNIIVADSRNNRIQIFEQNGSFLCEFGSAGKEPGQLDRPSGVCLTPDGKIVVVDFGNNRIQVF